MNHWTITSIALLILAQGCSRPQQNESTTQSANPTSVPQVIEKARPLNLRAIRPYLTHDLTMDEAERQFGWPGPVVVSGFFYRQWMLDDSNILLADFSLDTKRLQRAFVKSPKGEIVERVLELPKR